MKIRSSIQSKLIGIFVFTSVIILGVNIFMFFNINSQIKKIEEIYISNVTLINLTQELGNIQNDMTEYLNTKSADAMENYFRSTQNYLKLVQSLNRITTSSNSRLMEKNIYHMSESYLTLTNATVNAKRGRIIEKYKVSYGQANELFNYINTYIYSLNNERFLSNSDNYNVLLVSLQSLEYISSIILLVVIITNIIIAVALTRSITYPLSQLARTANEVGAGNFDVANIEVRGEDEIAVVANAFNQMAKSIQEFIERIRASMELERTMKEKELIMETHLKDAQLKYLQAQINPHFLFNTLNAGAQLAMMEGADKTYEFIGNMAEFFRYNIKKDNEISTLKDEIMLVDNYIYILNVRFSGEIHFKKYIDESLISIQVPGMILQPIVENCFNYGLRDIEREGLITLSVYKEDYETYVSIKDNGVGISEEKIQEVMNGKIKKEQRPGGDSNGIGLINVISRLRMFYEKDDVLEINSYGINKGTEVIIHIPHKKEGKINV